MNSASYGELMICIQDMSLQPTSYHLQYIYGSARGARLYRVRSWLVLLMMCLFSFGGKRIVHKPIRELPIIVKSAFITDSKNLVPIFSNTIVNQVTEE